MSALNKPSYFPSSPNLVPRPQAFDEQAFLTRREVAALLRLSIAQFEKMRAAGRVPAPVYLGRLPRWKRHEILCWMAAGCPHRQKWEEIRDQWMGRDPNGGAK